MLSLSPEHDENELRFVKCLERHEEKKKKASCMNEMAVIIVTTETEIGGGNLVDLYQKGSML